MASYCLLSLKKVSMKVSYQVTIATNLYEYKWNSARHTSKSIRFQLNIQLLKMDMDALKIWYYIWDMNLSAKDLMMR